MKWLFLTDDRRLNLFWRLLTYTVIAFVIMALAMGLAFLLAPRNDLLRNLIYTVLYVGPLMGATYLWRRRIDRRPWAGMAFAWTGGRGLLQWAGGFLLGAGTMALLVGVAWLAGWLTFAGTEVAASGWRGALYFLLSGLLNMVPVGICEELMMRGYWFQNLGERFPVWVGTVLMGVAFGLLHIDLFGFNAPFLLFVASALGVSIFLAMSRLLTGSLWLAMGWHTAWNWAQGNLFNFWLTGGDQHALIAFKRQGPDLWLGSSGTPEEGLLVFFAMVLSVAILLIWARLAGRPLPWLSRLGPDGAPEKAPAIGPEYDG